MNRPALAVLAAAALAAGTRLGHPPGLGLSVVTVAVFAAAMLATPRRDPWSIAWWLGAAALAAVASLRAAEWVVWPCLVAATALASLAATGGAGWRQVAVGLAASPTTTSTGSSARDASTPPCS